MMCVGICGNFRCVFAHVVYIYGLSIFDVVCFWFFISAESKNGVK
jgi:hypothetical protein